MNFTIRRAQPPELPGIVSLLTAQMLEHDLPVTPGKLEQAASAALAQPALGQFLVSDFAGALGGVAYVAFLHSMEHAATVPLLEELYVAPPFRGQGAGRALLQAAVERFSRQPGVPMELEVDATHQSVEGIYERHGFIRRSRTRWIYFPPPRR